MIQDIKDHKYDLYFKNLKPNENDIILCYKKNKILLNEDESFIKYSDVLNKNVIYGFMVDEKPYFILLDDISKEEFDVAIFREIKPSYKGFILITGYHLYNFYINNKFCGRCGNQFIHSTNLRSLICNCGNEIFPTISPAVIVGLLNKNHDKILLTKYQKGHGNYALVAGYNEIGETLEDTIKREVLEEVGLHVKNIKYYKSQPWGLTSTILSGFWADIDDELECLKVDNNELKFAKWFSKDEIDIINDGASLTREMIDYFKNGMNIDL